jgi:transposase
MRLDGSEVSTSEQVDTCARKRRRWPESEKRRIVAETLAPGSSVSVVARRHDVNANQLFAWCRRYRAGAGERVSGGLVPVSLVPRADGEPAPGAIEIGFGGGIVVRVVGPADAATLRQVLTVLSGR